MNYKQVRHSNCEVFEELEQQWNEDSASVVNPFFKVHSWKKKGSATAVDSVEKKTEWLSLSLF